jgi:hypothetical protein
MNISNGLSEISFRRSGETSAFQTRPKYGPDITQVKFRKNTGS